MNKNHFCPVCLDIKSFKDVYNDEYFDIRGESIKVNSHYLQCNDCAEKILDPSDEDENFKQAYAIYRKKKNLLFPEEILELREKYGLSQRQLAKILGWSHVTISRYESGALQSTSHNNELVLIKNPKNLMMLLAQNQDNMDEHDVNIVKEKLEKVLQSDQKETLYRTIENNFKSEPSEYTGFKIFNLEDTINIIRYFANKDSNIRKVKLLKYLWYSDFLHFKRWTVSLTGLKYSKYPMGPVPQDYELLISLILNESGHIERRYVDYGYPNLAEVFYTRSTINESEFSPEVLKTLEDVYKVVSPHNSSSISELSHRELGWLKTEDRELISYKYAKELKIN